MIPIMDMEEEKEIILDPRQKLCWDYFANPKSETFSNRKRSAMKAGYSEDYSNSIGSKDWFQHRLLKLNLLPKAERVLNKTLDMVTIDGEGKEQADLIRVQTDVAKFVAKTLGKEEGYSERTEVTGKDGGDIVFLPVELMDKYGLTTKTEDQLN